ncbi:restriction endonuclease subunit S [uncultured Microbulbifer sp.]|uniref:restriction endonuclease subunit S n=1 Tax=uncultured Microbulbifer sp. TaxID=348147 RepID=UPI0026269C34|nr:restriction endonuclease subunit S [uncultured Microbulbifer sp.]
MESEWQELRLGDVVEFVADNRGKNPKAYAETGIPVIDNYLITSDWRININNVRRFIDEDTYNSFIRKHIKEDDVLVTLVGNGYGQVGITPSCRCVIIQNTIGLRCTEEHDNKYLYYLLKLNRPSLMNLNIGAAQPSIKVGNLLNLVFPFPPLGEQKAISKILAALDDKIELNRQINSTLESMAQALFKSWFVDFDPVIDNTLAAGNPIPDALEARARTRQEIHTGAKASTQNLPAEIQRLFPSSFVFTEEMGWIPEGWEVSTIGTVVETTGGGTPSTKNPAFWEGGEHPFCTPKDMSQLSSWMLTDTDRHLTDVGVRKISSGQLPAGSVLMSSRAPIGYLAISNAPISVNQGVIAMLPNSVFGPLYLLNWTKSNMGYVTDRANGSTFLEISKKNFKPIPFLVPNGEAVSAFNEQAVVIQSRMLLLTEQISGLTKLRDSLLPKLLSGQIEISEAEHQLANTI